MKTLELSKFIRRFLHGTTYEDIENFTGHGDRELNADEMARVQDLQSHLHDAAERLESMLCEDDNEEDTT